MKSSWLSFFLPAFLLTAGSLFSQPIVTQVLDGAALTTNLAQGSVFIVKGTTLTSNGVVLATAPTYPTTLNTVRITLTPVVGGSAVNALMVYTFNDGTVNQLAGVVPSTTAIGAYDLRVLNGNLTSAAFRTNVQARKPGIVSSTSDGLGIAQATLQGQLILQRNTNVGKIGLYDTRAAHPGDVMTLWGTGLGPDTASDAGGSNGDQTAAGSIRVVLNGSDITPSYAGRSFGYPGLDQVNFTIPNTVALKCDNTVQIRAGGVLSNQLTIATSTTDTCTASNTGGGNCPARANSGSTNPSQSQAEINEWASSGQYCAGSFSVSRSVSYVNDYATAGNPVTITRGDNAAAQFTRVTGSDLNRYLNNTTAQPGFQIPAPGVCNIFTQTITDPFPNLTFTYLDGGTPLSVRGPNGTKTLPRSTNSVGNIGYNAVTGAGVSGNWMDPGTYTFTGPGSTGIGTFSVNIVVPTEFVVTNANSLATASRSTPLTVTWSGGDTSQLVFITGSSYVINATTGAVTTASFQCYENGTAGRFSVPVSVLQQLPASGTISGHGFLGL